MDFGINWTSHLLATNHVDDDGDFKPTASAMHLVNGQDFGQYGQKLYGDEEGDLDDGPEPVVCPPCSRDKDGNEEDENEREFIKSRGGKSADLYRSSPESSSEQSSLRAYLRNEGILLEIEEGGWG